jgi:hypothetical protein
MKQKKANQSITPLTLKEDGADIGATTLMTRALTQGALGQIDRAFDTWREATSLAKVS